LHCKLKKQDSYFAFLGAAFFAGAAAAFVAVLAGLDLPKLPANIFPFFVLISPRHIIIYF